MSGLNSSTAGTFDTRFDSKHRQPADQHHRRLEQGVPPLQAPGVDDVHLEGVDHDEQAGEHDQERPVDRPVDLLGANPVEQQDTRRDQRHQGDRLPREEQPDRDQCHRDALDQESAMDPGPRRFVGLQGNSPRIAQRLAIDQRHDGEVEDQADQGDGGQPRGESQVGDLRQRADDDVLRIARDRGDRADVRGRRQADQVRDRRPLQSLAEVEHQRRQGDADDVVDQKRREDPREGDRDRQQGQRSGEPGGDPFRRQGEEAGQAEIGHHHHHAEEQDDRLVIDGPGRVVHREHAAGQHGGRADQGDPGPVDPQAGDLAEGQGQIGQAEDRRNQGNRGRMRRHGRGYLRGSMSGWNTYPTFLAPSSELWDDRELGRRGHRVDHPAVDEFFVLRQRLRDEEDDDRRRDGAEAASAANRPR